MLTRSDASKRQRGVTIITNHYTHKNVVIHQKACKTVAVVKPGSESSYFRVIEPYNARCSSR